MRRIWTIGLNRVCRIFRPDVLLLTDMPIVTEEASDIRCHTGPILTWHGLRRCYVHEMSNARYFELAGSMPRGALRWPEENAGRIIREGTTSAYAMQIAVLAGASRLGIIGVDFSAPDLRSKRRDTHFYGDGRLVRSTGGGGWSPRRERFHKELLTWAASRGCACFNLSPFDDTPIHRAGWPKMTVAEFVAGASPAQREALDGPEEGVGAVVEILGGEVAGDAEDGVGVPAPGAGVDEG
ncbi:MAG: hypothetical protein H6739_36495 [Alphaproteobacteria bacterium]|nr:hypothetical protein [Alphaproteobacteria bacterium]